MPITYQELARPIHIQRNPDHFKITCLMRDDAGQIIGGSGIQTSGDRGGLSGAMISLKPRELAKIQKKEAELKIKRAITGMKR